MIDLSEGVPEVEAPGFLGVPVHRASFDRLVRALGDIEQDKDVKGIFVRFGGAQMGIARAQEIGDLLELIRTRREADLLPRRRLHERDAVRRGARVLEDLGFARGRGRGNRHRGASRLLPQAPGR